MSDACEASSRQSNRQDLTPAPDPSSQDSGRLEEVTQRADVTHLGIVAVPFFELQFFIAEQDPDHFERAGFIVSPKYGLASVPNPSRWVTALAGLCIGTWRDIWA